MTRCGQIYISNKIHNFFFQILGVTADNASNNDKMVEHLATLIETFPGAPNQTRCFAHILNLVAKSVLHQFEGPKEKKGLTGALPTVLQEINGDNDDDLSDGGNDKGEDECEDVEDDVVDDDEDGFIDEVDELSEDELARVKESVKPIRLVLTKVSQQT